MDLRSKRTKPVESGSDIMSVVQANRIYLHAEVCNFLNQIKTYGVDENEPKSFNISEILNPFRHQGVDRFFCPPAKCSLKFYVVRYDAGEQKDLIGLFSKANLVKYAPVSWAIQQKIEEGDLTRF